MTQAEHAQSVADAYALRGDIMAACRWNLRADRVAQGALDRIAEGEGLQDLISDHNALAALIQSHAAAFAADTTFDPDARAESCRQAAANVEALTSGNATEQDKRDTADARDRAWTHFKSLHKSLRDAAEYALRADPDTLSRFTSAYRRKLNRKAKAKAQAQGQ
jgi:predicted nucleic acid-binding protein